MKNTDRDPYELMYDYDGFLGGVSVGDFLSWIVGHCGRHEARHLVAQFIVERSLEHHPQYKVVASDSSHNFSIGGESGVAILCDFPADLESSLHLHEWSFFVVDASDYSGVFSAAELAAKIDRTYNYYTLYTIDHA